MPDAVLRLIVSSCLFCVVTSGADLAPPSAYEGRPLSQIRYDPPAQPVTQPDLSRLVTLQPGSPLRLGDIRDTIKRLYGSGEYSNIEIEAVPDGDRVALVIRTTEQWFVGPVEVHG